MKPSSDNVDTGTDTAFTLYGSFFPLRKCERLAETAIDAVHGCGVIKI